MKKLILIKLKQYKHYLKQAINKTNKKQKKYYHF